MREKAASQAYKELSQSDADTESACRVVDKKSDASASHDHGRKRLLVASLFCLVFIAAELVGGYIANSLAVVNEALHHVFDLNSLLTSLLAAWIASWKPNDKKTFGYYRAEVIGACAVILLLWLLTGVLAYEAILRIAAEDATSHGLDHHHVDSDVMMLTAGLAVCANVVLTFILNKHPHHHAGSHCEASLTVQAALMHTLGDLVHSLGVFIAAVIIRIKPTWQKADPAFSLVGVVVVFVSTCGVLRDSINILLEGVPRHIRIADVRRDLCALNHVKSVHNVHVWCLTAGKVVLSAHVVVDTKLLDVNGFLWETTQKMNSTYNFHHSSIQIEFRQPNTRKPTSVAEDGHNKLE